MVRVVLRRPPEVLTGGEGRCSLAPILSDRMFESLGETVAIVLGFAGLTLIVVIAVRARPRKPERLLSP